MPITPRRLNLTPKRRALLDAMLGGQTHTGASASADSYRDNAELTTCPPLSFAQERLWFLDQYETDRPVYNIPILVRLPGRLNVRAVERAINEIVRRHGVLRTTFEIIDNRPVQMVKSTAGCELLVVELRHLSPAERESEIETIVARERDYPFDLLRGPLFRAELVRLGELENAIVFNMHHIVSDGWSIGVLMHEFRTLYEAFSANQQSPLPELTLQYVDFARQQREQISGTILDSLLAFWQSTLEGAPAVLELPTDHPRPRHQTFAGETQLFLVPKLVAEPLAKLSRVSGVTLFMTLLAAFKVLLTRYTAQTDIVVGTPIANRNRADIEPLIGFFVNTLVLRTDLSGNPTFRELLQRVRGVTLEAYAHQDLPFEKLVQELQPDRNLSHSPLFQVMFALQNAMSTTRFAAHASYSASAGPKVVEGTARFDLSMFLGEAENGIAGELEYNTALFERSTATRMIGHFQRVLAAVAENLDQRLSDVPLMSEEEERELLTTCSGAAADLAEETLVHQLFEAQARRKAQTAAVAFGAEHMSYSELDGLANRVARRLQLAGVAPDVRVGVCLERSFEMATAVLGVLKAGACYVPLDPNYPAKRLAFMVEDAGISLLITRERYSDLFPARNITFLTVEAEWESILQLDGETRECTATADNLAYVIYTSGSSGRPKGVAMPHQPLVNLIQWQIRTSNPGSVPCTLQFAALSFDVSFQELFTTWASGGTVVLVDELRRTEFERLLADLPMFGVGRLYLPPVALMHLASAAHATSTYPSGIREIICAGEQLTVEPDKSRFVERLGARLRNQYGPTETHVVSEFPLTGSASNWPVLPPIGRPIDNARLYVLDERLQLVPVGVPGQLYIGGIALARGYLNRPALTAERFLPDPFAESGSRMYQTGDLVRYGPDGNLIFMGRLDQQVKIRGFRIETGEVETALSEHPAVAQTVVIARPDGAGALALVAYVVPETDHKFDGGDLRQFLGASLPGHMIPSVFVSLSVLPLSPNGKIDRQALPAPDWGERRGGEFVRPRNSLEETMARIWCEVLRLDKVGAEDSFFDLGGHSLLATQVISRVRQQLGVELPLRTIFEPPSTVAELARAIVLYQAVQFDPAEAGRLIEEIESLDESEVVRQLASDI